MSGEVGNLALNRQLGPGRARAALRSSGSATGTDGLGVNPDIMTPTNAIIDKNSSSKIQVLSFGIDTLVLNVYGELSENLLLLSEMAKEDAQSSPIRADLSPLPPFLGNNLLMQPKGAKGVGGYEFLARSDDLTVQWKKPTRFKVPPMVVQLSSQCLWRLGDGGWAAVAALLPWLREVFAGSCEVRVSHFHQCADFQGWIPALADLGGIVKRADALDIYDTNGDEYQDVGLEYRLARGDALQGVAAGRSNRLRASIYDKTKEIRRSGKEWFRDVWAQASGYDSALPVWRAEGQYGRELLHKHRIETLDDLRVQQDALWRYLLAWFSWRERQPTDLGHPQRWPMMPAWSALWSARPVSGPLPAARVIAPKLLRLAQQADGCLGSFMAITGETDPAAALERLRGIVRREKGTAAMREVLEKKRARYASVASKLPSASRESLAVVAESRRVRGKGLRAARLRREQWDAPRL